MNLVEKYLKLKSDRIIIYNDKQLKELVKPLVSNIEYLSSGSIKFVTDNGTELIFNYV